MTITELGSIGELIGSIAVLATLVYRTYQTRQNSLMLNQSKEAQLATQVQANVASWDGFLRPILEEPEVDRFYRLVKTGARVPTDHYESLESLLLLLTLKLENRMIKARLNPFTAGDVDKGIENLLDFWISRLMKSLSSIEWWNEYRTGLTPEFANQMDHQLARAYGG